MNQLRLLGVTGALLFSTTAFANEVPGFYFGVSAGQATMKGISSADLERALESAPGVDVAAAGLDRRDNTWKIYGGARVAPSLGFELGFMDLGDFSATATGTYNGNPATYNGNSRATAFTAGAAAFLPVSKEVELFGKAGAYRAEVRMAGSYNDGGAGGSFTLTDSNSGLKFGLGAQVALSDKIGARLEWERLNKVGRNFKGTGYKGNDIDVISAGLNVKF